MIWILKKIQINKIETPRSSRPIENIIDWTKHTWMVKCCCFSLILFLFLFLFRLLPLRLQQFEVVETELLLTFLCFDFGVSVDFNTYIALTCMKTSIYLISKIAKKKKYKCMMSISNADDSWTPFIECSCHSRLKRTLSFECMYLFQMNFIFASENWIYDCEFDQTTENE